MLDRLRLQLLSELRIPRASAGGVCQRIEEFDDPQFPDSDTHYRVGDWEVVRVEQYPTAEPGSNYDMIAVCYCQYAPKPSPLMPVPSARISIDSFGGDEAGYQQYLESNAKSEAYSS
jgi:hypothetical protein